MVDSMEYIEADDGESTLSQDNADTLLTDDDMQFTPIEKSERRSERADAVHQVPLEHPNRDIRLIVIEPSGSFNDEIRCGIQIVPLEKAPRYTALSYACDPASTNQSHLSDVIICEDFVIKVPAAAYSALKHIRALARKENAAALLPLWIDAVCIEQSNLDERSLQVALMGQIYEKSDSLLIWLGEDVLIGEDKRSLAALLEAGPTYRELANLQESLVPLASRPWFQRRWSIQEYLLARRRQFVIGTYAVSDKVFRSALEVCRDAVGPPLLEVPRYDTVSPPTLKGSPPTRILKKETLLQSMIAYDVLQCQEPLDRIYSALGISSDSPDIPIDYRQDVQTVYTALAKAYVFSTSAAVLLAQATARKPEAGYWPSWVPDWRQPISTRSDAHIGAMQTIWDQSGLMFREDFSSYTSRKEMGAIDDHPARLPIGLDGCVALKGVLVGMCESLSGITSRGSRPRCERCLWCRLGPGLRGRLAKGGADFWKYVHAEETLLLSQNLSGDDTIAWVLEDAEAGYYRLRSCLLIRCDWKEALKSWSAERASQEEAHKEFGTTVYVI